MNTKLNKFLTLFTLSSCLIATSIFAENSNDKSTAQFAVPPAKNPSGEEALNFYIGAYYTYWVPYQTNTNIAVSLGTGSVQGGAISPAMNARSGFKVSAGANTTYDDWMVRLNYAWFYNEPDLAAATLVNTFYYSLFPTSIAGDDEYYAFSSQFQNQFNRIDAQLDRQFFAGNHFVFRPWLGLLAAWDQEYLHVYQTNLDSQIEKVQTHQLWWGIGPYAGAEGSFYFTDEFCGFVSSGLAMLLSNHQITAGSFDVNSSLNPTGVVHLNAFNEYNDMEPMFEATLGLRWDANWPTWGLCIDLAWEAQTYLNHARFSAEGLGDYSMQGLTVGAKVSF